MYGFQSSLGSILTMPPSRVWISAKTAPTTRRGSSTVTSSQSSTRVVSIVRCTHEDRLGPLGRERRLLCVKIGRLRFVVRGRDAGRRGSNGGVVTTLTAAGRKT